jgi:hypothetical protein
MVMSLIQEVQEVERRVLTRLRELEPIVAQYGPLLAEYEALKKVAAKMGLAEGTTTQAPPPEPVAARESQVAVAADRGSAPGPRGRSTRRSGRKAAGDPAREAMIAAVSAEPGITVAQMAERLDVPATTLYRPVRELTDSGALSKRGRQLFPGA